MCQCNKTLLLHVFLFLQAFIGCIRTQKIYDLIFFSTWKVNLKYNRACTCTFLGFGFGWYDDSAYVQRITIQQIREDEWFKKNYVPVKPFEYEDVNLDDVNAFFDDPEVGKAFKYQFSFHLLLMHCVDCLTTSTLHVPLDILSADAIHHVCTNTHTDTPHFSKDIGMLLSIYLAYLWRVFFSNFSPESVVLSNLFM